VAGLLAVLDGRAALDPDDWRLAGMVADASTAVRDRVRARLDHDAAMVEQRTRERLAGRAVAADAAVERRRTVDAARRIAAKVWADPPREWTVALLRRAVSSSWRDAFGDGLDHAIAEGWVIVADERGQGADKRCLRRGPMRP
jgi:hypothetical protein